MTTSMAAQHQYRQAKPVPTSTDDILGAHRVLRLACHQNPAFADDADDADEFRRL